MYKSLAIVILNYNGKTYLESFLPSVVSFSKECRIIIADNASSDDSLSFINKNYPNIEVIQNGENGGFAKGYNDALKRINSKYYLLLNSDIEVTEDWLNPLLTSIQDENVAGCQPKVLSFHNKSTFEHAGASGGFLDRNFYPFCRGRIFDLTETDYGQYDSEQEVFWCSGACLLIKSDVFHDVGGFDEDFFAHMEEIDLCWRIKAKGFSFKVIPSSVVYHVGGGTLSYHSPRKTYLNFRNSLYMITKNYDGILLSKILYRLMLDGIAGALFLIKGSPNHTLAVINAHKDYYKKIPKMLSKRIQLKKNKSENFNANGVYTGSILWARYFKGVLKYSNLNHRLFKR